VLIKPYMLAEAILSEDIRPLPRYLFDPQNLLSAYSLNALRHTPLDTSAQTSNNLKVFAAQYNQIGREPKNLTGSGPYYLQQWVDKRTIILQRKTDYWADKLTNVRGLEAYPQQLIFKILPDFKAAYIALRNQELDIVRNMPSNEFETAQQDAHITHNYHFYTPQMFACHFIGMNAHPQKNRNPIFTDIKVRQAFLHILDKKRIQKIIYHDKAKNFNHFLALYGIYDEIAIFDYNLKKADSLLVSTGWVDANGDSIKEKVINGKNTPFIVELADNEGNENRKNTGLILQK